MGVAQWASGQGWLLTYVHKCAVKISLLPLGVCSCSGAILLMFSIQAGAPVDVDELGVTSCALFDEGFNPKP